MSLSRSPGFLRRHYGLNDEVCKEQVSDKHIAEICSSLCGQWRKLPPYLDLTETAVSDLEREFKTEEERRVGLLKKWKGRKGFEASYTSLIGALLEIDCRSDAEGVCKLLKKSHPASPG